MDTAASSGDNTDYDDSFEDAPDSAHLSRKTSANSYTRSLTGRSLSTARNSTPKATDSFNTANEKHESGDAQTDEPAEGTEPLPEDKPGNSPLLTAHRLSNTSLHDVNLSGVKSVPASPRIPEDGSADIPHPVLSKDMPSKPPALPSRFPGFAASLPSVPWGPPPVKTGGNSIAPPPVAASRKISSPFTWLGRATSTPKDTRSPPLPPVPNLDRRNTAASISTLGSNPELMLKTLETSGDANGAPNKPPPRTTLRDRFKLLRLREEAGITSLDESESTEGGAIAGLIGRSTSLGLGIGSPTSIADEQEDGLAVSPGAAPEPSIQLPKRTFTIDPGLAPGTVAGAASSPITPIDWDFWQSVVNEGPQAVARTSPEELTQAFVGGIPQTIRGVIWQVLANSKNEDLEGVYRELIVRGTDKEFKESNLTTGATSASGLTNGHTKEKESIASSSSSIRSEHSTKATSANIVVLSPSPSQERDPEGMAKLQAALIAERKQKAKDDSASLQKLEKMIKRDMGSRTSYSKYTTAAGLQDGLFNVCKAYALFDEAVGYPQGMNFIIMPILFNMPEEEAFCLLVRLMNKYGARDLFTQDMPGLHLHLYQFERLLEDLEPAVYCHLNRRGVEPKLYATQWFLTLFAYRFPLQLVMRVYDLILSEGLEGAILKFGMAVIQRNASTLLGMNDMLALSNFLKDKLFDVYIDQAPSSKSILESGFFGSSNGADAEVYRADLLVQDAAAVKLTPEMLLRYRGEWEEKVKQEKDREMDLESLRSTIVTQTVKVRQLEERTEQSDTEHVQIASELVRLKVQNEELHDSNESLRGQVEELKRVAASEAQNVEDKLKDEMERVMKRNLEVQNENRNMEESMSQMEQDLVATKMKYAEINENYESLRQKWNDLRKALD